MQGPHFAVQAVTPLSLVVKVCTLSGSPIPEAAIDVNKLNRGGLTDENGIATARLSESDFDGLLTRTKQVPDPNNSNATVDVKVGTVNFEVKKSGYGPLPAPGAAFAEGPVTVASEISRQSSNFSDDAPGVQRMTVTLCSTSDPSTQRVLNVVMATAGTGKGTEHANTRVRRLTIAEADEELLYHEDRGNIAPLDGSKYIQPNGSIKRPSKSHPKLGTSAENVLVEVAPVIAGVKIIALQDFVGVDQFVWKDFTKITVNYRHAVALVRLCRVLYAAGYRCLYTSGINAETGRNDCHGVGRAIDIAGVGKALPEQGTYYERKTAKWGTITGRKVTQRPNIDFIVYFDWGKTNMLLAKPTSQTTDVDAQSAEQKSLLTRYNIPNGYVVAGKDGYIASRQKVNQTTDTYATDPTTKQTLILYRFGLNVTAADRPKGSIVDAAHLKTAGEVYQMIYEFVRKNYSAKNGPSGLQEYLGPVASTSIFGKLQASEQAAILDDDIDKTDSQGRPLLPQMGSEQGHVFCPEYPKAAVGDSKFGRQPHENHFHVQLGPTYP